MKKVELVFVVLMLGMISFGSAFQANVTVIDDIGSFSGAFLKIKSVDSDVFIDDKIYPSEYLMGVGIAKFNLEISLSEINVKVVLIKSGQIVDEFEEGPFSINGSDILIDRREKAEVVEISEVVDDSANETIDENVSGSTDEVIVENVSENVLVVEDEVLEGEESSGFLSGMAMFDNEDGSFNWKYSVGGGVVVLLLVVFVVGMVMHRRKTGNGFAGDDEKELEYMEKKVKEIEGKIVKIKNGKAVKSKLVKAKAKLEEEEAELKELEGKGNEKKIERQEKVVDRAEEKVENVEDQEDK